MKQFPVAAFLVPTVSLAALALAGFALVGAKSPPVAAAAQPATVGATTYTIDPVHSTVIFSLTHLKTSRSYGSFQDIAGTVVFDPEHPETAKVSIQIQTASIDTNSKDRDAHLKGPDFFEVKEYPAAKFESSAVKPAGDKKWTVLGTLDLHGVKKDVTLTMELLGTGKGFKGEALVGFHGTTTIKRSDFGIKYGPGVLGDEVDLIVSVEAAAQ
jgi:polyisoprenoid-binding protein YceI